MAVPDAIVITYTSLLGISCILCIILFIKGFILEKSEDAKLTKASIRVLFCCALCYAIGALMVFIGLIIYLISGWNSAQTIYLIFNIFYVFAWLLMMYVWIQRLETTFANSAYEYSKKYMKRVKILFWFIIANAVIGATLWTIDGGGNSEGGVLRYIVLFFIGIFIITFISLITLLFYSFVSKLNRLRKVAEERLSKISDAGDYDFDALESVQKLVSLQLKLTILALTAIISTLIAMIMVLPLVQEAEFMVLGTDCVIGFVCMYCTIKTHHAFYERICTLCIKCCNCCFNTSHIEVQAKHHIELHSRSLQTNTKTVISNSGLTNTSSNGTSGSNGITITTAQGTSSDGDKDHATPRPSGISTQNDSHLPVVKLQNNYSATQSDQVTVDKSITDKPKDLDNTQNTSI